MDTTLVIEADYIRLVLADGDRVKSLDSWSVPKGLDPIDYLAQCPLPTKLGTVKVACTHQDMLLRPVVQDPCPPDRLERLLNFETKTAVGDNVGPYQFDWHLTPVGGTGAMRIATLVCKDGLIKRIREALTVHNIKVSQLVPTGLALFQAWKDNQGENEIDCVLLHAGERDMECVIVKEGNFLYTKRSGNGLNELINDVSELRHIDYENAKNLVEHITDDAPDDIKEMVFRHAQQIATNVTATLRYTQAQYQLDPINLAAIYVSGSGMRVPLLSKTVASRLKCKVQVINPFSGRSILLNEERMNNLAELPSSWDAGIGLSDSDENVLDALSQERNEKRAFWSGPGFMRVAAIACIIVLGLTIARQMSSTGYLEDRSKVLLNKGNLVSAAKKQESSLKSQRDHINREQYRISTLISERSPGKISNELITVIGTIRDNELCPIRLNHFSVVRPEQEYGQTIIKIQGHARSSGTRSSADVLAYFQQQLLEKYPPLHKSRIEDLRMAFNSSEHPFGLRITVPDSAFF